MFSFIFSSWNHKEFFQRQLTFPFRSLQADLGAIGDENWHDGRWVNELGWTIIAENRVITIFAFSDQFFATLVFGQQPWSAAEIPAARTLAEIAADRGDVANLRAAGLDEGLGECRIVFLDAGILGQISECCQRADAQTLRTGRNTAEIFDVFNIHEPLRGDDVVFHQSEQVGSAGKDFGIAPGRSQQADRLRSAVRADVFKRSHQAPAFCPSAARTRSGVSGRNGTRTPMAFATAFEIAAPDEITGGSPSPITPRSS